MAKRHPVVGIGASAGGLKALETFFKNISKTTDAAFIVITHLAPNHRSYLAEIISRHSDMPVTQVSETTQAEPNHVYVMNPESNLEISADYKIKPVPRNSASGINLPIDYFFRSLAEACGEHSAGVILSGSGSDGTLGVKALKEVGALILVQTPNSAEYEGMPRSAIKTQCSDYQLPLQQLAEELTGFLEAIKNGSDITHYRQGDLCAILNLLKQKSNHDFGEYKENTIRRRVERRMVIHQAESLREYTEYLRKNPKELDRLFNELLIGVTQFFRDPLAFKALKEQHLQKIISEKDKHETLRIWVAGCSTGEEAYSLAILIQEISNELGKNVKCNIFATDIDMRAIDRARRGRYPKNIMADVTQERLNQYFNFVDDEYEVKKFVRDMIVFAEQDIARDPAFSRLDLVSCRNLLIYFGSDLQNRLIPMFHYTLVSNGILFLGSSESVGKYGHLFELADKKWKIFTKKNVASPHVFSTQNTNRLPSPEHTSITKTEPGPKNTATPNPLIKTPQATFLKYLVHAAALVDENYDVLFFHGEMSKYLALPEGDPSYNILAMSPQNIRFEIKKALEKSRAEGSRTIVPSLRLKVGGNYEQVDLIVVPVNYPSNAHKAFIVSIYQHANHADRNPVVLDKPHEHSEARINALESELKEVRENLQTTIEELEASNEELRSTNEELQSSNEELQSTNEELETSREELQSLNEELATVNSELEDKIEQLANSHNDIKNLLDSTQIAVIFLDSHLKIKRYTPEATKVVSLIPSDVGRPISDLSSKLDLDNLETVATETLRSLTTCECGVKSEDNRIFHMRVLPYRTANNIIDGVVLTFTEKSTIAQDEFLSKLSANSNKEYLYIANLSPKGTITAFSGKLTRTQSMKLIIGKRVKSLIAEEHWPSFSKALSLAEDTKNYASCSCALILSRRAVETTCFIYPLTGPDKVVKQLVCAFYLNTHL